MPKSFKGVIQAAFAEQSANVIAAGGNLYIISPVDHWIRGFLLERTLIKNRYYLWQVVVPLYTNSKNLLLDYSLRVGGDEGVCHLSNNLDAFAEDLSREIVPRIDDLRRISSPTEFLKYVEKLQYGPRLLHSPVGSRAVEIALTHWLNNDKKSFLSSIMSGLATTPIFPYQYSIHRVLEEMRSEYIIYPFRIDEKIRIWEARNRELHIRLAR